MFPLKGTFFDTWSNSAAGRSVSSFAKGKRLWRVISMMSTKRSETNCERHIWTPNSDEKFWRELMPHSQTCKISRGATKQSSNRWSRWNNRSHITQNAHMLTKSSRIQTRTKVRGNMEQSETKNILSENPRCQTRGYSRMWDKFAVIKGTGRPLLEGSRAEKLQSLRVGQARRPHVYLVVPEGNDKDFWDDYADIFTRVRKLKDYQVKIHVDKNVALVAQQVWSLLFGLRDRVHQKFDDLLDKDNTKEVPNTHTAWVSPSVVAPQQHGDIQVCVDMRRANKAIVRERHLILQSKKSYTILDLLWGFY